MVDFPLSVTGLTTTRVTVNLTSSAPVPPTTVILQRSVSRDTGSGPVASTIGGAATTTDGTAGTGRGAAEWNSLCTGSPVGDWQLSFSADADSLFTSGALTDITLMIGWTGQGAAWT
jgi:hypothetical protein